MQKLKNIPELRFPKFEGEWERKKLGEVISNKSGKYNPDKENHFTKCIELEHLATESGQLLGYIDGSNSGSIKNIFEKGDVLFGKLRPYLKKYLQAPFDGVCSSEIWVLKGTKISNDFLYRIVQTNSFIDLANQSSGSKMPRADWSVVSNGFFSFPSLPEQTRIATFFTALDKKISELKQKKTLLEQYKKGMMQKLFSQELRFRDDNGNGFPKWKEKMIGEIAEITTGNRDTQNKVEDGKFPFFVRSQTIEKINSFSFNGEAVLTSGDGVGVGKNFHYINGKFDFHQRVYCIRNFKSEIYGKYFFYYFSEKFNFRIMRMSAKNSVDSIRRDMIYKMPIDIPALTEQMKITNFLSAFDEKINRTQLQIEKTEQYKKGLLQMMFC